MELINCNSSFNQSYMKTRDLAHQAQNQHYSAHAEFVDGAHSGEINLSYKSHDFLQYKHAFIPVKMWGHITNTYHCWY